MTHCLYQPTNDHYKTELETLPQTPENIAEALALFNCSDHVTQRKHAKLYLEREASPALLQVLTDLKLFRKLEKPPYDIKLKNLYGKAIAIKNHPEIDYDTLLVAYWRRWGVGVWYLLGKTRWTLAELILMQEDANELTLSIIENVFIIPKEIGQLTQLRRLHLINCSFGELPNELGNLKNLQFLELSNLENLAEFPKVVGKLTALQTLKLQCLPKIKALPEWLSALTMLQKIAVYDYGVDIPDSLRKKVYG